MTTIASTSFNNCTNLKKYTFECSTIGAWFSGNTVMEEITIGQSVTSISDDAFKGCSSLKSVAIPENVTSIGTSSFRNCIGLVSASLPSSITTISADLFRGCTSLSSVTLPEDLQEIGKEAFYDCSSLPSISFPQSITTIGGYAFRGCTSLTEITIPVNMTTIASTSFAYCSNLKKYNFECSNIGAWLSGNTVMEEITIGQSVTSISDDAFKGCSSLKSVAIPKNVTSIGTSAFRNCTGLVSASLPSSITTISADLFRGCTSLSSVTLPEDLQEIGKEAFYGCSGLPSISFPISLTSIGGSAFYSCSGLSSIYLPVETPFTINETVFSSSSYKDATLYVPAASVDLYKSTNGWKKFENIVGTGDTGKKSYTLLYLVDGEKYKEYQLSEGTPIIPEPAPAKEGYSFSGWSEIPETMPAKDLEVTGYFQPIQSEQNAHRAFYIYRNDGGFNGFFYNEVDSIVYSKTDTDGSIKSDYVVQEVWTADSVYRIPLAVIDSIGLVKPETIYADHVKEMSYMIDYIVSVEGLNLYVDKSFPTQLLPSKEEILIYEKNGTHFPNGFAGKVSSIEYGDEIKIVCIPAFYDEIYDQIVECVEFTSSQAENANGRALARRNYPGFKIPLSIGANILGAGCSIEGDVYINLKSADNFQRSNFAAI